MYFFLSFSEFSYHFKVIFDITDAAQNKIIDVWNGMF